MPRNTPLSVCLRTERVNPNIKQALADRNLWQTDSLHHRPHDGKYIRFGGEGVNLIGALAHEAPQAFNGLAGGCSRQMSKHAPLALKMKEKQRQ